MKFCFRPTDDPREGKKQPKVKKTPVKNIDFDSVVKNTKSSKSIFLTGGFL